MSAQTIFGYSWDIRGMFAGQSWDVCGIFVGCFWIFVGCFRDNRGVLVGYSCDVCGINYSWDVRLYNMWDISELSCGCRDICEMYVICQWMYMGCLRDDHYSINLEVLIGSSLSMPIWSVHEDQLSTLKLRSSSFIEIDLFWFFERRASFHSFNLFFCLRWKLSYANFPPRAGNDVPSSYSSFFAPIPYSVGACVQGNQLGSQRSYYARCYILRLYSSSHVFLWAVFVRVWYRKQQFVCCVENQSHNSTAKDLALMSNWTRSKLLICSENIVCLWSAWDTLDLWRGRLPITFDVEDLPWSVTWETRWQAQWEEQNKSMMNLWSGSIGVE